LSGEHLSRAALPVLRDAAERFPHDGAPFAKKTDAAPRSPKSFSKSPF